MLTRISDRLRYGPLDESGQWLEYAEDYEDIIREMEDVDVEIEEWYDPVPEQGILNDSKLNSGSAEKENLNGEEAWKFANSALEKLSPSHEGITEIPFYFEHRSRNNENTISLKAQGFSNLGSSREYYVSFNGNLE